MRTAVIGLVLISAATIWAANKFQPLNVKPGLWESTTTVTTSGQMPIPASMLAKLTPERRAKMEAAMKARSGQHTTANTHKSCETKEKLQETPFADRQQCTETVVSSTSKQAELKLECNYAEMKASGTLNVEAISDESVKGSGHMTATAGGRTMNSDTSFSSKWLGASCGDVK